MEVFKSLPQGTLAELIDNIIYMSPSPAAKHQLILNEINFQLLRVFRHDKKAIIFIAPIDVYFDEHSNAVQPDISIVLAEHENIIDPNGHIHGVPDVLVEILSPGNKEHDLIKKKSLYEKFGVKEYWIVDPETKLALCYSLQDRQYVKTGEAMGTIRSALLGIEFGF